MNMCSRNKAMRSKKQDDDVKRVFKLVQFISS